MKASPLPMLISTKSKQRGVAMDGSPTLVTTLRRMQPRDVKVQEYVVSNIVGRNLVPVTRENHESSALSRTYIFAEELKRYVFAEA